jgi:Skp family chaperone for outer membrane proteins
MLALAVGGSATGYSAEPAPNAQATEGTRVAVVDVSQVFTNFKKVFDVQTQVDAQFNPQRLEIQKLEADLKKQAEEIAMMRQAGKNEESEMLFDAAVKYQRLEFAWRNLQRKLQRDTDKAFYESMRDVLNEIKAAISKEAKLKGFAFVLRTADSDDALGLKGAAPAASEKTEDKIKEMLKPQSTFQLLAKFDKNPVMYGAQTVDITQAVLEHLNKDYQKFLENKSGTAPKTPAPK